MRLIKQVFKIEEQFIATFAIDLDIWLQPVAHHVVFVCDEHQSGFLNRPLYICVVCPMHGSSKSQKTQENSDAKRTDMPPAPMADIEMAKQKIDSHQLAIDKLTFALNTIKCENEQENDPTIKEKLN
uniref:Uncharacterized protein n=1 Tax=Romanomermis culicivorax TaxID=13658 RepID=A0A915I317_ROMCU